MWPVLVVVLLPFGDLLSSVCESRERGFIQAFVLKASVEALDEGILCWLSKGEVMPINLRFVHHLSTVELVASALMSSTIVFGIPRT